MIHPIFSVLVSKPELVMEHVAGYAALFREEASSMTSEVARRAIAWAACGACLFVFLLLAGVAVMLGAIQSEFSWALVIVPGIPLAIAIAAFTVARKPLPSRAFTELRSQLDADAQALRGLGSKP